MNSLQPFLELSDIDPTDAMNRLQEAGIVSDNCVTAADVAEADCERAVEFLCP